jgi:hypothetical protein
VQAFLVRAMSSRLQAVLWVTLSATFALLLAPLSLMLGLHCVSGALVGLATLRQDAREAGIVLLGATAATSAIMSVVAHSPQPALMLALMLWAPVWAMCVAVRAQVPMGVALGATGGAVILTVLAFRVSVGDPGAWWMDAWTAMLDARRAQGQLPDDIALQFLTVAKAWAPVTTGIVASGFMMLVALTLFAARWAHGAVDNPGGFGREFKDLSMPGLLSWATLALGVIVIVAPEGARDAATELVMVTVVLHTIHGLAIVHCIVAKMRAARGWLVFLYVMLLLMPLSSFVALALAVLGFSDRWGRYRERVPQRE